MKTVLALILVAMLAVQVSADQVRMKQLDGSENLSFTGGAEVTGLPATPSGDTSAASKAYVDSQSGGGFSKEAVYLAAADDTIVTLARSALIEIFSEGAALPTSVTFNHTFSAEEPDFHSTTSGVMTIETGTPTISGGMLDLTNGNSAYESSAVSYVLADAGGFNVAQQTHETGSSFAMTVRFRPNWDGIPAQSILLFSFTNGDITIPGGWTDDAWTGQVWIKADANKGVTSCLFVAANNADKYDIKIPAFEGPSEGWQKNKLYEIHISTIWGGPGAGWGMRIWFDGYTNFSASTTWWRDTQINSHWLRDATAGQKIIFGGMQSSRLVDKSPYFSNHFIDSFTVWSSSSENVLPYNDVGITNPTPNDYISTYTVPGALAGFETIEFLDGTNYTEGDEVTLISGAGQTWELIPSTGLSPAVGAFEIKSKFTARNIGDKIKLKYTGTFWTEIARHYIDPGAGGPGVDKVTLEESSTTLKTLGGEKVLLFPPATALASDVKFVVNYSDNSATPDFAFANDDSSVVFVGRDWPSASCATCTTPDLSGGYLNMDTSAYERSYVNYSATSGDNERRGNEGTVRIMYRPSYSGSPTSIIGIFQRGLSTYNAYSASCQLFTTGGDCRATHRLIHRGVDGRLWLQLYDTSNNREGVPSFVWSPTADQLYEIEYSWNYNTGHARLFVDGVLESTDSVFVGADYYPDSGDSFHWNFVWQLGGGSNQTGDSFSCTTIKPCGRSNHKYAGWAVFSTEQHTASYTPTGLPGVTSSSETITKMTGGGVYREGQRVSITAGVGGRWTLTDSASPTTDEFELNGDWSPGAADERLSLVRSSQHWVEVSRFPLVVAASAVAPEAGAVDTIASITLVSTDSPFRYADTTSNSITYTLPPCSSLNDGLKFNFKKMVPANSMVIDPDGSETIDSNSTPVTITTSQTGLAIRCVGSGTFQGWQGGTN